VNAPVQIPGYRLLRTLGEGGMATVYLATQESLEREVALKVMAPALAANSSFCEQFIKEGRITAKLSHPHLVTVHDIGSHNGVYYLASEYLPAGTLRDRLQNGLTIAESLDIARDIASGLAFAHNKGFVHRDVKPGNILFRTNGSAVLADFGIAKAIKSMSSATMAGNAIGTPDYMSPEQAQASLVDGRSDLYSLGAVLFEMLTGAKPYQAKDPYAVALKHITEPVPRLPEPLMWLQPLIDGTMAKDPTQRYASGEAFVAAVDALLLEYPQAVAAGDGRGAHRRIVPLSEPKEGDADASTAGPLKRLLPVAAVVLVLLGASAVGWRWMHSEPATVVSANPNLPPVPPPPVPSNPVDDTPLDPMVKLGLDKLKTDQMLKRAQDELAFGLNSPGGEKLSYPEGDNAIDLFREVLKREPGNQPAAAGLDQIAAFYTKGAQLAVKWGSWAGAISLIEKGLKAKPDDPTLVKLKQEWEQATKGS
jgi:serine/threonine-protein kinase PpkA